MDSPEGTEEGRSPSLFARVMQKSAGFLRRNSKPGSIHSPELPPIMGGAVPLLDVRRETVFQNDDVKELYPCLTDLQRRKDLHETVVDTPKSFNLLVKEIRQRASGERVADSYGKRPDLVPLTVAINWSGVHEDVVLHWKKDGDVYLPKRLEGQKADFTGAEKFITAALLKAKLKEEFPPVFLEDSQPGEHPKLVLPSQAQVDLGMFDGEEGVCVTDVIGNKVRPSEILATHQHLRGIVPTGDPMIWYMTDSGFEVLVVANRTQLDNLFFTNHEKSNSQN